MKFAYNQRRALLEQGCHLNTCNPSQTILLGSLKVHICGHICINVLLCSQAFIPSMIFIDNVATA